ncbi:hypothetical protein WDZ17_05110 [Pseudokineococcus basanitobsidens]|uniref:Uncharacterized protein n=1 Tax=Pseudokineococcus basanitobsidens TaxID=1926649 RepID=A0ABU8RHX2_9ACTN
MAGPPVAVLVGVVTAAALDVSAPAAVLLTGPTTGVGWGDVAVRLLAVALLAAASLAGHDALRRSSRPGLAVALPVLVAAPVGGLALVEPDGAGAAAGLLAAVLGAAAFVRRRASHAGFTAGLLLAVVAVLVPASAVVALVVAATASRWPGSALRGEPGAGRAVALVLAFPVLAVGASWAYLAWRVPGVVPGVAAGGSPLVAAREALGSAVRDAAELVTGAATSLASAAGGLPPGVAAGAVPALVLGAVLARGRARALLSLLAAAAGVLAVVVTG